MHKLPPFRLCMPSPTGAIEHGRSSYQMESNILGKIRRKIQQKKNYMIFELFVTTFLEKIVTREISCSNIGIDVTCDGCSTV